VRPPPALSRREQPSCVMARVIECVVTFADFRPDPYAGSPAMQEEAYVERQLRAAGFRFDGDGPGSSFVGRWDRTQRDDGALVFRQRLDGDGA
jgi:hypothetical protein